MPGDCPGGGVGGFGIDWYITGFSWQPVDSYRSEVINAGKHLLFITAEKSFFHRFFLNERSQYDPSEKVKAPETFRALKATLSPSVSKNGEVHAPETSCMKGTSVHIKNMDVNKTAL